jgi:hypothetical protein
MPILPLNVAILALDSAFSSFRNRYPANVPTLSAYRIILPVLWRDPYLTEQGGHFRLVPDIAAVRRYSLGGRHSLGHPCEGYLPASDREQTDGRGADATAPSGDEDGFPDRHGSH